MKGVGRKVKGVRSFASSTAALHANFGLESSYCPTLGELVAQAKAKEAREMEQSYGDSMRLFLASLQT